MPIARDFFVSYNRRDKPWAEWIAWQLEEAGYSSLIQAWDFRPGSNFVIEMQIGLTSAHRMILVLSANYLKSDFTAPEWAAVFGQDPQGMLRKLVPVRVADCNPTGLLTSIVYIDLVGKEEVEARQELLEGLQPGRAKPPRPPAFPKGPVPAYPKLNSPDAPSRALVERSQCTIVLTGTIDPHDRPLVEAILEHLKKIAEDAALTIVETRKGSIKVTFEGPRDACERIVSLFERGRVSKVAGLPVEELNRRFKDGSEVEIHTSYPLMLDDNYKEILNVAKNILARTTGERDLDPGDLANSAAERLLRVGPPEKPVFLDEFKYIVTRAMRHFLLDEARGKRRAKRSSLLREPTPVESLDIAPAERLEIETTLDVQRALEALDTEDSAAARVLELRYFSGLTVDEVAKVLRVSIGTVYAWNNRGISFMRERLSTMSS